MTASSSRRRRRSGRSNWSGTSRRPRTRRKMREVEGKLASTCATVKDLLQKHDATVARMEAQQLQHGDAIQAMERKHAEETSRLQDLMSGLENRNSELVEVMHFEVIVEKQ